MRKGVGSAQQVEFIPWKPDRCEEPGCEARWPSFSRDGMKGPWRCQEHDRTAAKRPDPHELVPDNHRQGSLL